MSVTSLRWSPRSVLLLSLLLTVGLRVPFLPITFFNVDEAVSAVAAEAIRDGGLPYRDAIDHRGPLTYYAYAVVFALMGEGSMWAVHVGYLLIVLAMQVLVFGLGKWLHGAWCGAWAALAYGVFAWSNPFHEMWAAHTEWLLTLLSAGGLLMLLRHGQQAQVGYLLLMGVCWGLATLSKQVAVLECGAILGFWGWLRWREGKWRSWWGELAWIGLGGAVTLGGVAGYFWARGAWSDWVFYVWTYNTQYYMPEVTGLRRWENAIKLLGYFIVNKPLLLLLLGLAAWRLPRLWDLETFRREGWLWAWVGGSVLAALAGGRVFLHYLIPALAPLSLLSALGLMQLWDHRPGWLRRSQVLCLGSLGLLISLGTTFYTTAFLLKEDMSVTEFLPFVETIRAQSQPDEPIFVWGFAPELYYLSGRPPASRFSFCNVLTGYIPAGNESKVDTRYAIVPGVWDSLYQDLSRRWPSFIVDTQPANYREYGKFSLAEYPLGDWMEHRYILDSTFHREYPEAIFHLYRRQP